MKKFLLSSLAVFALIGCGGGGGSSSDYNDNTSDNSDYTETYKSITITEDNQIEKITQTTDATINITVPDEKKDIYLVVTSHYDNQDISIDAPSASDNNQQNYKTLDVPKNPKDPQKVLEFRKIAKSLINKSDKRAKINMLTRSVSEDDSETFCVDINLYNSSYPCTQEVDATARKVITANTKYGEKTLVIWVEDDEYSNTDPTKINQQMVDDLAETFLKDSSGTEDDIYDWVTNVYGEEWGSTGDRNLISDSDYIDILVYNMDNDSYAGFFWPKDNYTKDDVEGSNEKIMFYINSAVYHRSGYTLEENEKEIYTTLAHEFQHMINFYQRTVLKDLDDQAWLNEMLSETTEDLIATKIEYIGPRAVEPYNDGSAGEPGIDKGRYPTFNQYNYYSLTSWDNLLADYSKVSAFGTFLTRNYGGAKVLHDIMYSNNTDAKAVEDATGEDFNTLLSQWGAAVILSDNEGTSDDIPRYNFGDFKNVSYNGITYNLGSINFFNYDPQPTFKSSATLDANANLYYHLGELEGSATINVDIPKGGDITIIAK